VHLRSGRNFLERPISGPREAPAARIHSALNHRHPFTRKIPAQNKSRLRRRPRHSRTTVTSIVNTVTGASNPIMVLLNKGRASCRDDARTR
jgi:hypothetical protein